jgi:hypothetical protein
MDCLAATGSLFLLHIKLEGMPLWSQGGNARLAALLAGLGRYRNVQRDLHGFKLALDDAETSLIEGGDPNYELSVIATVVRHCSVLACYLLGDPQFERQVSIPRAFAEAKMSQFTDSALALYNFRLAQARGVAVSLAASQGTALEWCSIAAKFVARVGDMHNGR